MADPAGDQIDVGMPPQEGDLFLQPSRVADVVAVHAGDQAGTAAGQAPVEGGDQPVGRLADEPDAGIRGRRLLQDGRGGVGRAVVDHHQLPVLKRLTLQRGQCRRQEAGLVAHGHQD